MIDVTVITASLPRRASLLAEAVASVGAQTQAAAHLICVDDSVGVAEARNQLVEAATTSWIAFLDDDDHLDTDHIETLAAHAADNRVDVVIPHCRFEGPPLPEIACCGGYYNRPFAWNDLRRHGIFPITVLARRSAVLSAGGFPLDKPYEDWELWKQMYRLGCAFEVVPKVTWTYRTKHTDARRTGRETAG
jgi:glycosyltransferase involved in cell wall biosynthesis